MVMADTVQAPGGDAAVLRVHGSKKALAVTSDCTPRYCEADPFEGGKQAVAEAWRNLTAVGARPLAITNCLNFGNPERREIMGQLVGCIDGMAAACRALDFPVVSGNVSLYNETDGKAILPTPTIGGVGLLDDFERMVTIAWSDADLALILVGESEEHVGVSLFQRMICGRTEGAPPPVRLDVERRNGDFVREAIQDGLVAACHDLADGGLAVSIAEMVIASGMGATIEVPDEVSSRLGWLFGEDQGRYLLAIDQAKVVEVQRRAAADGVVIHVVGWTGGDALTLGAGETISVDALRDSHEAWLPAYMADRH